MLCFVYKFLKIFLNVFYDSESSKKHKQIYSDLPEFPGTQTEILTLRPVKIKDFPEYVADMIKNGNVKIAMEFEDLNNASPKFSTDVANLDANKVKNRYANILPFDESRVKLSPFDSENDNVSGYINANYMPGHSSEKEYIATQRPLPGTVNDFWRMVWEKNVSICVMLTLDKKHLVKKSNYWPSLVEKEHRYGNITVHISSEVNANSYVVRVFKLMMGKQKHKLKHFQFLIWEDCETNMSRDVFISFVNNVRLQLQPEEKEWPIVVHCSSGVGRTGTFIAIDFLMQFIENNDFDADIDILNYIYEMRKHRMKMVQTTQQLIFIYECAKIMIQRKYKCQEAMNKKNAFIVEIETDVKDTYEDAM